MAVDPAGAATDAARDAGRGGALAICGGAAALGRDPPAAGASVSAGLCATNR